MPVTQEHIDRVITIAQHHGADRVLLFGSALDDPANARDLDVAVGGVPGWNFFGMAAEMEKGLPIPIDVIPLDGDSPFARHIQTRGRVVYERG